MLAVKKEIVEEKKKAEKKNQLKLSPAGVIKKKLVLFFDNDFDEEREKIPPIQIASAKKNLQESN